MLIINSQTQLILTTTTTTISSSQPNMNQNKKSRQNSIIKRDAILIGGGILYYIFIKITGFSIPCIFRMLTGLLCPGCGITRCLTALADLNLKRAFSYNQYLFFAGPVILFLIKKNDIIYVRYGNRSSSKSDNVLIFICIVTGLLYAVIRNCI